MANASGAVQLRNLIKKLDVPFNAKSSGQIHVYYLNHGDAETLAKTLNDLVSAARQSTSRGGRTSRLSRRASSANNNSSGSLFNNEVKITSDKDNNALVVTASPTDYLTIKEVIKKLDIPRDQVYVEGLIMETNVSNTSSFGISWIAATGGGNVQRVGINSNETGFLDLLTTGITNLGGLFTGVGLGKKVTLNTPDGNSVTVNTINGLIKPSQDILRPMF